MDKGEPAAACNGDQQEELVDNLDEDAAAKEKLTSDPNKVKFTSVNLDGYDGKNGEAKVDIFVSQGTVGMGKEELMKHANEPFWVRLRLILFVFFWLSWIAMLIGAVGIILVAPRCPPAPKLDWYQKTTIYQVDVGNFKDSDGDGIGDFKGLISKLDYFKLHNIGTILLSSFYESADNFDEGIIDHKKVDPRYGTMADFDELVSELKNLDIKLIIDFNPDHTSDKHPWFIAAVENKQPFVDYYIWKNETDKLNNWKNISGLSAWKSENARGKFWLSTHGFYKKDLNLRNPKVREEMASILKFWLSRGVNGFKVMAASHLIEDLYFRDEPLGTKDSVKMPGYEDFNHIFTIDQPENLELFAEWREILDNFNDTSNTHRIMLAETSGSINGSLTYYGNSTYTLADLPFSNKFCTITNDTTGIDLMNLIDTWSINSPANAWPTFLVGSKSCPRLANRYGDLLDGLHMVSFLARGTPITYYGDELGLKDKKELRDHTMEPKLVMLWSNDSNAGFSKSSEEVIQVPTDFENLTVQAQEKDKGSHLNIFKRLAALRGQPALGFGLQDYPIVTNETFSMIRVRKGSPAYLVVINLSSESTVLNLAGSSKFLPEIAKVEIRSRNLLSGPLTEGGHPKISLNNVALDAHQSVVLSFVPQFKD